jgi:hypothetical protein
MQVGTIWFKVAPHPIPGDGQNENYSQHLLRECDRNPSVADIRRKFVGYSSSFVSTPFLKKFRRQNNLN